MNKIQSSLLALTLFSLPIVATLKGKGTPVLVLVLFMAFGLKYINQTPILFKKIRKFDYKTISFWTLMFVIWSVISCVWHPDIGKAFGHSARYFVFILCGYITFLAFQTFKKEAVPIYTKLYFWSFILFLAYIVFEVLGPSWVSVLYTKSEGFNKRLYINAIVIMVLLFWPFVLILKTKYGKTADKFLVALFPFVLLFLTMVWPNAALIAFSVAFVGYLLSKYSLTWIRFAKYSFIIISVALPVLVSQSHLLNKYQDKIIYLATSYQHRLYIWNGMANKNDTLRKKIIGNGFDFSTTVKGGEQKCFRQLRPKFNSHFSLNLVMDPPCKKTIGIFTSHPHNGIIQIYVELGVVGLLIFLIMIWKVFGFIENEKDKILRGVYFATLLSYLVIFFISFGLWQTWMAGLMILTVNSLALATKNYQNKKSDH